MRDLRIHEGSVVSPRIAHAIVAALRKMDVIKHWRTLRKNLEPRNEKSTGPPESIRRQGRDYAGAPATGHARKSGRDPPRMVLLDWTGFESHRVCTESQHAQRSDAGYRARSRCRDGTRTKKSGENRVSPAVC